MYGELCFRFYEQKANFENIMYRACVTSSVNNIQVMRTGEYKFAPQFSHFLQRIVDGHFNRIHSCITADHNCFNDGYVVRQPDCVRPLEWA